MDKPNQQKQQVQQQQVQQPTNTLVFDNQCIICQQKQSSTKKLMNLFSYKQWICLQCYKQQNQMIVQYKKNKPVLYPDYDQIIPGLYLGNQDSAMDQDVMVKNKIQAICVCGSYLLTPFEDINFSKQKIKQQILYWKLDIADYPSQKLLHLFNETIKWIHNNLEANKNVLVHCAAGVSRSSSFVIAYLMKYQQMKFTDAYHFVKHKRKFISPNSGFINQLKAYQQILQKQQKQQKQNNGEKPQQQQTIQKQQENNL